MKLLSVSGVLMLLLLISSTVVHSVAQQPPGADPLEPVRDDVDDPFAAPLQSESFLTDDGFTKSARFAPAAPPTPTPARIGNVPELLPSPLTDAIGPGSDPPSTTRNTSQQQQLGEAVRVLQNPESTDEQRSTAREFVQQALRQQFASDLENRRKQLAAMEKQLTQLREQLTRRADAMEKLVDLRLQLLENEASGLAFPEAWSRLPGTTGGRGMGLPHGWPDGVNYYGAPIPTGGSMVPGLDPSGLRPSKPDSKNDRSNKPAAPRDPLDDGSFPPYPSSPKADR